MRKGFRVILDSVAGPLLLTSRRSAISDSLSMLDWTGLTGEAGALAILSARCSRSMAFARSVFDKVDVTGSHAYLFSS